MAHPYPQLAFQPGSNLDFQWAFASQRTAGDFSMAAGPDGVVCSEVMYVDWGNLKAALQALIGYSYRDISNNPLGAAGSFAVDGVSAISPVSGITITATNHGLVTGNQVIVYGVQGQLAANGAWTVTSTGANSFTLNGSAGGNAGAAYVSGTGEWRTVGSVLRRKLPWQHPQFNQLWVKRVAKVRGLILQGKSNGVQAAAGPVSKLDIGRPAGAGIGAKINTGPFTQFVLAELTIEFWRPPYAVRSDADIIDSNGLAREWTRYTDREWHNETQMLSREATAFVYLAPAATADGKPVQGGVGQKVSHNKVTRKWYQIPESALFTTTNNVTPDGLPWNMLYTQTSSVNPLTAYILGAGSPIAGCVNTPIGGSSSDAVPGQRLFGAYAGTLLFETAEVHPQPLQLPAELMGIGFWGANEPISQVQYDVTLRFDIFDPTYGPTSGIRGHNLFPYSGDGLWYPVTTQAAVDSGGGGSIGFRKRTPFDYADLSTLFQIL